MKWRDVTKDDKKHVEQIQPIEKDDEVDDAMFDSDEEGQADGIADRQILPADQELTGGEPMDGAVYPEVASISQGDLFQKAVEASYWAGYWAAAYKVSVSIYPSSAEHH